MSDEQKRDPLGHRERDEPGFEQGFDQEPDTPEEQQVGRFSTGVEQTPERSPEKDDVGRFSTGIEQTPEHEPEKDHEGHYSEGNEHAPGDDAR
jgi:hypothetical protein